jgi:hypothetical protein
VSVRSRHESASQPRSRVRRLVEKRVLVIRHIHVSFLIHSNSGNPVPPYQRHSRRYEQRGQPVISVDTMRLSHRREDPRPAARDRPNSSTSSSPGT